MKVSIRIFPGTQGNDLMYGAPIVWFIRGEYFYAHGATSSAVVAGDLIDQPW